MWPSKVIPLLVLPRQGYFDQEDTAIITRDRFPAFAQLVERYQCPVLDSVLPTHSQCCNQASFSITIHVSSRSIRSACVIFTILLNVYVHIVIDSFDSQFNTWRNVARMFARTDFGMMLDVDFTICIDFRRAVRESVTMEQRLKGELAKNHEMFPGR
jgi:hypothetical protein